MPTIGTNSKPAYVYDAGTDTWIPIGPGEHTHDYIGKNVITTTGDIIYASAANTPARLGIGSTDQVLKVSGGLPTWGSVPAIGAFTSYTPTWTNLTVGNGTNIGQYYEDAEKVTVLNKLTFGSTTSISGSISFSLPVNATTKQLIQLGGWLRDTGSGDTVPWVQINNATTAWIYWPNVDHVNSGVAWMTGRIINATTPWTWAVNDEIVVFFTYEKA